MSTLSRNEVENRALVRCQNGSLLLVVRKVSTLHLELGAFHDQHEHLQKIAMTTTTRKMD